MKIEVTLLLDLSEDERQRVIDASNAGRLVIFAITANQILPSGHIIGVKDHIDYVTRKKKR